MCFIRRVFKIMKLVKEIKSKEGVLHFRRWQLLKTRWFTIYIHGIYHKDEDTHLHNHPWNFINMILKGSYTEQTVNGTILQKPFRINKRKGSDYHKILNVHTNVVYTLFIIGSKRMEWGYLVNGKHVEHSQYRQLKRENKL